MRGDWRVAPFVALVACAGAASRPTPPVASAAPPVIAPPSSLVEITVTEDPSTDHWSVAYHFGVPVIGVTFVRGRARFRNASWTAVADDGNKNPVAVSWHDVDTREAVVAGSGTFTNLVVSFATETVHHSSNDGYWLNESFTDGSRLLYTGHFAIGLLCPTDGATDIVKRAERSVGGASKTSAPSECSAHVGPVAAADIAWKFRTTSQRHIVVEGARAKGELAWTETTNPSWGTYAYFGEIEPRDTPFGRVILDPGLPTWMVDAANKNVPLMLDWFAKDTLVPLSQKSLVLISYNVGGDGHSFKGGGLPGIVQVSAWGKGWAASDPKTRFDWAMVLAHETFHVWNAEMFTASDSWLAEGSSTLFATRVLQALGLIDTARYRHEIISAANMCMMMLRRRALMSANPIGSPTYSCGATLMAWADAIARDHNKTIGDVLGAVFAVASSRPHHSYKTEDFMQELAKLEPDPKKLEPFDRVLHQGLADHADEVYQRALSRPDFVVTLGPIATADVDAHEVERQVGIELALCDCDHRINLRTLDTGLDFLDSPECATLKNVRVTAVEGHTVPKDALAAYRALLDRRPNKPINVDIDGKAALKLTCRAGAELAPFRQLLH